MPFTRRQSRVARTGSLAIRLTPAQRDVLIASPETPKDVGHLLHRATVREGKLAVRLKRDAIDALIAAAARVKPADQKAERDLDALLRYLETAADRFEREEDEAEGEARSSD